MPGSLVPLVMLPRYTTYTGQVEFTTIGMDVTKYETAILSVWRGRLGGAGTVQITCEESTDSGGVAGSWSPCSGTNTQNFDPGEEAEAQVTATLTKRWFRLRVALTGTNPQVTCWAVGFLEDREE